MKNSKSVIAGAMALLSAVSVASCGSSSGGDSSSSYVDKVKVASTDDIATIPDGSEKELEWLSYFDINPTKKEPEKRTDLTLFEERGGKIKYSQTSYQNISGGLLDISLAASLSERRVGLERMV